MPANIFILNIIFSYKGGVLIYNMKFTEYRLVTSVFKFPFLGFSFCPQKSIVFHVSVVVMRINNVS